MQKFSKKLVSKVIYVKILKSSSPELLEAFLNEKGWELLNAWFTDAIKTQNWPLCTELLALLALCPISASRLKENLDHNQAPRLVRQLSSDARVDSGVRHQAGLLLTRWMSIVSPAPETAPMRSLRITRSVIVPTPRLQTVTPAPGTNRVLVAVHTSTEEIINMGNMTVSNSGMTTSHNITSTTMSATGIHPVSVDPFDAILAPGVPQYSQSPSAGQVIGVIRNECLDDAITKPVVSPIRLQIRPQAVESKAGGVNILAELSNELSETLKKEVQDEVKKEASADEKNKREKERNKDRDKERSRDSHKSKERDREKDRHRDRDRKDRDKKNRDGDEKRRREKERQREKEKREKKPRESKSFREAEVRDGLDCAQKQRIKELAEKMRQEVKSLPKIPKVPKSAEAAKEKIATLSKAPGGINKPSFTDLMNAMGTTSKKTVKAAPIKNKNRLLLESLESSETSKPTAKTQQEPKKIDRTEYLLNFKTEDKSALVKSTTTETKIVDEKVEIKTVETGVEDKKAVKRPLEEEPKLKIKSQSQLSEGSGFSDFLSTIIPDVPKKKKIKFSDLKAQKEASLKAAESSSVAMDTDVKEETESSDSKPAFSFYGGGNTEGDDHDSTSDRERSSSPKEGSIKDETEEMEVREENSGPREVRGILVINKGAKRSRCIQWRAESKLVEVEYFEVEEGERVNVNKLKFEEQRKKELELEKMRMMNKPELETDDRPWPLIGSLGLSCEMPDIEYGGNSKEKKEQQLRETSTLQALFFNKNGPSDPLEPDSGLGARLECRPIPLEDTSGEEEAVNDYSELGWPEPVFDKFMANNPPPPVFVPPPSLLGPPPGAGPPPVVPSASHILQNLIGGGGQIPEGNQQAVDSALFAAQKAAAETLLKQGLLPPVFMDQNVPPETEEIKHEEEYMEHEEFTQDTKPPLSHHQSHTGGWRGGPPQPQRGQRGFGRGGGGPNHRMNNHHGHNNEFGRGGGFGGLHHPPPQRGGNFPQRGFQNRPPNGSRGRPCKFWMETGYCRQENRCKFLHPAGPGGPGVAR